MKNYLLLLLWLVASPVFVEGVEEEAALTTFRDEGSLLMHLSQFNASKRATVIHGGTRYHIYAGGKGSAVRYFYGFIFRETDSIFILVSHVSYTPITEGGFFPIASLTPEIDEIGIKFLARSAEPSSKKELVVAKEDFANLKKVGIEGIEYQTLSYPKEE